MKERAVARAREAGLYAASAEYGISIFTLHEWLEKDKHTVTCLVKSASLGWFIGIIINRVGTELTLLNARHYSYRGNSSIPESINEELLGPAIPRIVLLNVISCLYGISNTTRL